MTQSYAQSELIFNSEALKTEQREAVLFRLQNYLIDEIAEQQADHVVITTTCRINKGGRDHWVFDPTHRDVESFWQDLIGEEDYHMEIYRTWDEKHYAWVRTGVENVIWKFHFVSDLGNAIEQGLQWVSSQSYDELKDSIEDALVEHDYIGKSEEMEVTIVEGDLGEASFYFFLPYMTEAIMSGKMFYEEDTGMHIYDEQSLWFEDSYETFIQQCLF